MPLDNIILEIEYGGIPESIFESIRERVDSKMITICPDVINKLQVVYENVSSGERPESWSHVAASCRRIIKDIADSIFPSQSSPVTMNGKEYKVGDAAYINRILARLSTRSNSTSTFELVKSMFYYTEAFLRNIQQYASKGDHSIFTKSDASRCLVYTYLLLGDILDYYVSSEKVTKKLRDPYEIRIGIQKYRTRNDLPLRDILGEVQREILFVSTSHEIATRFKKLNIKKSIKKGVKITIMILNPYSTEVSNKQKLFGRSSSNLKDLIKKELIKLCSQKKEFRDIGIDLLLKTYDWPLSYSYIVIDPQSENPLLKVEKLTSSEGPDYKKSDITYKSDNPAFYEQHWREIQAIQNIGNYICKSLYK